MSKFSYEIKAGKGINTIIFGCKRELLKRTLGEPTEKEIYNATEEEDYQTEDWHYDELETSFSFDEEDGWRLTTIATSSPEATIKGKKLIGLSVDEALAETENMDLGDNQLEDFSDEGENQKLISFLDTGINLWFENDVLSEIQWAVLWSDEDTPEWP
jgi:DNA-binding PucR family transcriptional regulator